MCTQTILVFSMPGVLGDILPGRDGYGFPVLCYAGYLVAGMAAARRPIPLAAWGIAAAGTLFLVLQSNPFATSDRFPPTPLWIMGSAGLVLTGYALSERGKWREGSPLVAIGRRTLPILIGSTTLLLVTARLMRDGL